MRTRVKICGFTRAADAMAAVDAGADALGFAMFTGSSRAITAEAARDIMETLPAFVTSVALFVNPSKEEVLNALEVANFQLLQFHGDETEAFCQQFDMPYMKVFRVKNLEGLAERVAEYPSASGIMLDTLSDKAYGGTGESWQWQAIPDLNTKIILAGGLDAENVGTAIEAVKPYAVDVSSGVEIDKGIKDPEKIRAFIEAVQAADRSGKL